MSDCKCMSPPFTHTDYDIEEIGCDEEEGRYGDVALWTCRECGAEWLRYFVEYESFTGSGRFFMGLIPESRRREVKPENAIRILDALPWRFIGGSFFGSSGMRTTRPCPWQLMGGG